MLSVIFFFCFISFLLILPGPRDIRVMFKPFLKRVKKRTVSNASVYRKLIICLVLTLSISTLLWLSLISCYPLYPRVSQLKYNYCRDENIDMYVVIRTLPYGKGIKLYVDKFEARVPIVYEVEIKFPWPYFNPVYRWLFYPRPYFRIPLSHRAETAWISEVNEKALSTMSKQRRELINRLLKVEGQLMYINVSSSYKLSSNGILKLKILLIVKYENISYFLRIRVYNITSKDKSHYLLATLLIEKVNRELPITLELTLEPQELTEIVEAPGHIVDKNTCLIDIKTPKKALIKVKISQTGS